MVAATPPAVAPADAPWRLRYSARILDEDVDQIGEASLEIAQKACEKKLTRQPDQYGDPLHHPLLRLRKLKSKNIRIAYHVVEADREVWILMMGDRRDIWEHEQGEILGRFAEERAQHIERVAAPPTSA